MNNIRGKIFDIQGFSVHDGPGCRTLIFMKGCTLQCRWCSNPEGQTPYPVPMYNKTKCIFDKACIYACPNNAIKIIENSINIDRNKCVNCSTYACSKTCSTGAIKIAGYEISIDDLLTRIERDRQYWGDEGGITLSGGEPLFQSAFAEEILKCCYEKYIHTAIETCGNVPWTSYEKCIQYIDWIFFDLKHIDRQKHILGTGADNDLILNNIEKLFCNFTGRLVFRITIIPKFNDSDADIKKFAEFINSLPDEKDKTVNILSLHHYSKEKYKMLEKKYFSENLITPGKKRMNEIKNIFESYNINCFVDSDTSF